MLGAGRVRGDTEAAPRKADAAPQMNLPLRGGIGEGKVRVGMATHGGSEVAGRGLKADLVDSNKKPDHRPDDEPRGT